MTSLVKQKIGPGIYIKRDLLNKKRCICFFKLIYLFINYFIIFVVAVMNIKKGKSPLMKLSP